MPTWQIRRTLVQISNPHHGMIYLVKSPARHSMTQQTRYERFFSVGWASGFAHHETILCTPSKTMDAWMLTAIFADNDAFQKEDWECHSNPERQLNALPKEKRFSKKKRDYLERSEEISQAWPRVSATLTEAKRFEEEFLHAIHGCHEQPDNLPHG